MTKKMKKEMTWQKMKMPLTVTPQKVKMVTALVQRQTLMIKIIKVKKNIMTMLLNKAMIKRHNLKVRTVGQMRKKRTFMRNMVKVRQVRKVMINLKTNMAVCKIVNTMMMSMLKIKKAVTK